MRWVRDKFKLNEYKLMKGNSFFYAIVGMTVAATLSYLNKATGKHVDSNEKGEFLLKMHKLYKIVGYVSLVIGLIVTIGPILTDKPDAAIFIMMFLMFLIFIGLGLLCVLFYRNHYLRFDNSTIEVRSAFAKTKIINWEEIKSVSFNPSSGLITLKNQHGQKIKVHQHLIGLGRFISYLETKTDWTAKKLKLPVKPN